MYFDKIIQALKDFDAIETAAVEVLKETKEKLTEDYGNIGRVYEQESAKARRLYNETIAEAKQKGKAIVKEEIEKINGIVRDFVTTPVPSDFPTTLEAVKAAGKSLTSAEAEAYLEKYKGNYTAYLGLANVIVEARGENVPFVRYDAIKREIEEYGEMAMHVFDQYGRGGYMRALFTSDQHTPLRDVDIALQRFMKEDVSTYKTAAQIEAEKLAEDPAKLNQ